MCFIKSCRKSGQKYYGITSTTFGTGTQNVRRVDFPSLGYFSLPKKNPNKC